MKKLETQGREVKQTADERRKKSSEIAAFGDKARKLLKTEGPLLGFVSPELLKQRPLSELRRTKNDIDEVLSNEARVAQFSRIDMGNGNTLLDHYQAAQHIVSDAIANKTTKRDKFEV